MTQEQSGMTVDPADVIDSLVMQIAELIKQNAYLRVGLASFSKKNDGSSDSSYS